MPNVFNSCVVSCSMIINNALWHVCMCVYVCMCVCVCVCVCVVMRCLLLALGEMKVCHTKKANG